MQNTASTVAAAVVGGVAAVLAVLLFIAQGDNGVLLSRSLRPVYGTSVDTFIKNPEGNIVIEGLPVQLWPKLTLAIGLVCGALYYAVTVWHALRITRKNRIIRSLFVWADLPSLVVDPGVMLLGALYAREPWLGDVGAWALVVHVLAFVRALLHHYHAPLENEGKRARRYEFGVLLNTALLVLSVIAFWRMLLLARWTLLADASVPGWQAIIMLAVPIIYGLRALWTWGAVLITYLNPSLAGDDDSAYAQAYVVGHLAFIGSWLLLVGVPMTVAMWND
jgi:hypothetical protein